MALGCVLCVACSSHDEVLSDDTDENIIHVGGVSTDDMVTTAAATRAAVAADSIAWLKAALQSRGMTINYYQKADDMKSAILKRAADGTYSLTDANSKNAKWLGNGAHYFEGVYVPGGLAEGERMFMIRCAITPPCRHQQRLPLRWVVSLSPCSTVWHVCRLMC